MYDMELQHIFVADCIHFYRVNLVLESRSLLVHLMLIQRHYVVQLHTVWLDGLLCRVSLPHVRTL